MSNFVEAMKRISVPGAVAMLLLTGAVAATPASAQTVSCGERQAILDTLKDRYHEGRTAYGVTADGRLLEVFSGPSGSWTLLMTQPGGKSCLMSSGEGWRHILEMKSKDPVA